MTEVVERKIEEPHYSNQVERLVDDLTLLDDDLMSKVFDGNIPAAELVLRIVLEDDELEVISVNGQRVFKNLLTGCRDIRFDILIQDRKGRHHNVEVQRSNDGANERRARFHSSMMDSRMLKKGQDFACKNTEDMYYPELADSVRHFKEKGGRENMCEAVEKYAEERAAEAVEAAKEAMEKAERETAKKVKEAAIKLYYRYAGN